MYIFSVAFRHLRSRPISWIASLIIMLIVVLYLLIISVMEGFKDRYMSQLRSVKAHITVRVGHIPWGIIHPEEWAAKLEAFPEIRGVGIRTETPVLVQFDDARTIGTLLGIDLTQELKNSELKKQLQDKTITAFGIHKVGLKPLPGCLAGMGWKKRFGLKKGGHITFMFTDQDDTPRALQFHIIGFYKVGAENLEQSVYVDHALLARELGIEGNAKTLSLWVKGDPDRSDLDAIKMRVHKQIATLLDEDPYVTSLNASMPNDPTLQERLKVETWRNLVSNLYYAITRENQIMRVIMGFFLLFAIIIIFLILGRQVAEKIRDIGVLRALGATPFGIQACFVFQGLAISGFGLLFGLPAAGILIHFLTPIERFVGHVFGFKLFPKSDFLINEIPTKLLNLDITLICIFTIFAGFLGALIPAWNAARLNPVDCLRHE